MNEIFKIVCDCRESFSRKEENEYNDHFSQKSIKYLINILSELGYNSIHFGGINELIALCHDNKFLDKEFFINLSDGLTQKSRRLQAPILLEILGANYSGSEPFAISLANNKAACKKILSLSSTIKVPNDVLIERSLNIDFSMLHKLNYPVIVKPNAEGSSVGITQKSFATTPEKAISYYNSLDMNGFDSILFEEYVMGYEVTALIIGNYPNHYVFPLMVQYNSKIYFEKEIMDIEIKKSRKRKYIHPGNYLSKKCFDRIIEATIEAKNTIGLRDIARVDFRITKDEEIVFLEANSNPVLSGSSELGAICKLYNISEKNILNYYMTGYLNRVRS